MPLEEAFAERERAHEAWGTERRDDSEPGERDELERKNRVKRALA